MCTFRMYERFMQDFDRICRIDSPCHLQRVDQHFWILSSKLTLDGKMRYLKALSSFILKSLDSCEDPCSTWETFPVGPKLFIHFFNLKGRKWRSPSSVHESTVNIKASNKKKKFITHIWYFLKFEIYINFDTNYHKTISESN